MIEEIFSKKLSATFEVGSETKQFFNELEETGARWGTFVSFREISSPVLQGFSAEESSSLSKMYCRTDQVAS